MGSGMVGAGYLFLAAAVLVGPFGAAAAGEAPGRRLAAARPGADVVLGERGLVNVNNVAMWFRRDGWSGSNPLTLLGGVIYPRGTSAVILQDGLVWGGRVRDGDPQIVRVGGQTHDVGTVPGRIVSRGVAHDPEDPRVRLYRVRLDYRTADLRRDAAEVFDVDPGDVTDGQVEALRAQYERDWQEWPGQWGAPFYDLDGDGAYDPDVDQPSFRDADCLATPGRCAGNADQVAWFVINDLNPQVTARLYGSKPLGLEVQTTFWAYARSDALGDAIFKRYRIIYRGTAATPDTAMIEDMYLAQWSDPDIGDSPNSGDDFGGFDAELGLGYAYNADDTDPGYQAHGLPPPAVGYDLLQGPVVPDRHAEALFDFAPRPGYRNLGLSSFVVFAAAGGYNDPESSYTGTLQWYNLLRGFRPLPDLDHPVAYVNPLTGESVRFTVDGDPVTGEGWVDGNPMAPSDRRIVLNTGPFEMALGDTQEVVVALVAGIGTDHLSSVTSLRITDRFVQAAFDSSFAVGAPPAPPRVRVFEGDRALTLDWGFDPDAVRATEQLVHPPFRFEGYNLYQFASAGTDLARAVKLATHDAVNGITTIWGRVVDGVTGETVQRPLQTGGDSGLQWIARIDRDAVNGGPLVNGQTYHFGVSAYSYNAQAGAVATTLESIPQRISAVPQSRPPGVRWEAEDGESLPVVHTGGSGDAVVRALVVAASELLDATYTVSFDADGSWHLWRDGTAVLERQRNFSLDDSYYAVDGVQVKVGAVTYTAATFAQAQVVVDADPDDGGLALLDATSLHGDAESTAASFWSSRVGGAAARYGSDDPGLLSRDLELRFTGVWDPGSRAIVSGGSVASLAGIEPGGGGRDLDAHPYRPADAPVSGPFLQRVPFEIWDVEEPERPRQLNASFYDRGADGAGAAGTYHTSYNLNGLDYITVIATDYDPTRVHGLEEPEATWVLFFDRDGAWSTGDVVRITYARPIVPGSDEFEFTTAAPTYSAAAARAEVERINVFPNPYYGLNEAETSSSPHFVTFSHLPARATIRIYDLSGTLVRTLEKDDPSQFQRWDLRNHNHLPVASGLYIAHIELPGISRTRVLKLALVQEQQFLEYY